MSRRLRWLFVTFLILAIPIVALASTFQTTIFFPVVIKDPTLTPTATATSTSTPTLTPSPTPTEKPASVEIIKIEYDPNYDEMEEYVQIRNNTNGAVDMTDWVLRDENRNIFFFPSFSLGEDKTVKVWTKSGDDTSTDLYWDSDEPIWNDGGDCAYLRDERNVLVDQYCY